MKIIAAILVTILITAETSAVTIPKYLKLCSRKDPNFSKCAVESGQNAISHLLEGDKDLNIPNLNPLKLPLLQLAPSEMLNLNFTDLELSGLAEGVLKDVACDTDKNEGKIAFYIPEAVLRSKYDIDGKIILPIRGSGACELKFYDGLYIYTYKYELIGKKGGKYAKILSDDVQFSIKKASFHFDNLFNGDKALGDQMNRLLNDNWSDIVKEFDPVIGKTLASLCRLILGRVAQKIPWDKLFLD